MPCRVELARLWGLSCRFDPSGELAVIIPGFVFAVTAVAIVLV